MFTKRMAQIETFPNRVRLTMKTMEIGDKAVKSDEAFEEFKTVEEAMKALEFYFGLNKPQIIRADASALPVR